VSRNFCGQFTSIAINSLIKRDNHYVPHSYLKRWADDHGNVWSYRILVPHAKSSLWKAHSPKSLGFHQHLYTQMAATGESDKIERWFDSTFESPAGRALQNAVTDQRLSSEEWVRLIRFLAAQDARTPARLLSRMKDWRENMQSLINEVTSDAVHQLEEAKRTGIPIAFEGPAADDELFPVRTMVEIQPGEETGLLRVEASMGRSLWLWSLKHVLTKTLDVLHQHRWTILRSPPGIEWLTSDNPVVRLNYHDAQRYDFGGGWNSLGTNIFMPLSPSHLLFTQIGSRQRLQRGTTVSLDFAMQIQRFTVEHAHRYVFGRSADVHAALWRPRTVNREAFHAEAEQWKSWNAVQSEAEREIFQKQTF
jgi:hypothetical protein